ncbi:MAG: LPXTG cell wall anchor domain-containing protein, partial [Clostridia bacterium]|nr:LPXTG cell wall anchor domain-containing protein [Clostridia bacterium]
SDELKSSGAEQFRLAWSQRNVYSSAQEYSPQRGDIVFFDEDKDNTADSVAIVISASEDYLHIISGNSNDKVEIADIAVSDNIIGYGLTSQLYYAKNMEYQEESVTQEVTGNKPPLMMSAAPEQIDTQVGEVIKSTDLTQFVVDVSFSSNGEEVTDGSTVYIGQTYNIHMRFKEDNEGSVWHQFGHNDQHFLTYQIPENIHCDPFTEWHPIAAEIEQGVVENVGEYFIDENGFLKVTFYDDENGVCFGNRYSDVAFSIEFTATVGATQSGESNEIVFDDEFNFKISGGSEMMVSKSHGNYNADKHTMEYTARVEAVHGVVTDLILDDYIWHSHDVLTETIVVTDLDGNVLDPQPTLIKGAERGFSLSGFPDFVAGEGYLVTYKTKIDDELISGDSVLLGNGIYGNGKDHNGNDAKCNYIEDWVTVNLEKMSKGGKQTVIKDETGKAINVIEWNVDIFKNHSELKNTVIIDTLGDGLAYYKERDILVTYTDEENGEPKKMYISWKDVQVTGNTMTFTLPDGYMFDITYYTTYDDPGEDKTKNYHNDVIANLNGEQETTGSNVNVVSFVPRVSKGAHGDDGEYIYFTIEADVSPMLKDLGGFFVTDMGAIWNYEGEKALYYDNAPLDMVITAETANGEVLTTFTPYEPGGPTENTYILVAPAEGNQYHSFNIFFNTSEATSTSSKWISDEAAILRITYKIPFDSKTGFEWTGALTGEKTLGDVLREDRTVSNAVYFNYTDVISVEAVTYYTYNPRIEKSAVTNKDGTIDYTVVFDNELSGSYGTRGLLNVDTQYAYFFDEFDKKLKYVPGSLEVTCYDPWNDNLWLCKYTYNGSFSGNVIEAYADKFFLTATNPEAAASWTYLNFPTLENYYQTMDSWYCGGSKMIFTYKLKLDDQYLNTTEESKYVLDNVAEVIWNSGTSGPADETVIYKTGLLEKDVNQGDVSLNQRDDNLYFSININQNAYDILPGSDTLTIEDTMTNNLSVYWSSIKVYYEDENGKFIDFDSPESQKTYSVTYDQHSNKLTFVVPDSLHVKIDYTTLITEDGYISVENAVKLEGKAQVTDIVDAIFKVEQHSGDATASIHNITLMKQDGDTDAPLPNVNFLLYGPMGDPTAKPPSGAGNSITTDDGTMLGYVGSYTTDEHGIVNIETQYLTIGGPYALVEVSPPEGYAPLSKPVYFYFYQPDPNGIIQAVTTLISVENYTYGFVLPETGGTGTLPLAIIGFAMTALPILYSTIRRKRERRLT